MRRLWWSLLTLFVVLAGITLLAVFPARTYWSQRRELAAAETRAKVLTEQNKQLSGRVAKLRTDDEVERIAREQYDLVKPGEEAYAILPPPEADKPKAAAAARAPKKSEGFWAKVGDTITFWN